MSPLIGNPYVIGDTTGNFKKLDDISSYTLTFNPSSDVSTTNDTITSIEHRFVTGQRVTYTHGGGTAIGGLTSGNAYYIVNNGADTIKLALTYADALVSNTINLTSTGSGSSHTINLAFDGVNTRFKATYSNGTKARITNAAQLTISINGVLQQPFDSATPANGYGIEHPGIIVFSVAPIVSDVFWGNVIANNFPTYDITDNKVDNFTGNGSQTEFTLSRNVPNNESLLVTVDGVTQYPSDGTTTRAYTIYDSILTFSEAPANGAVIQARHIGFAGAVTSAVTGFNGRTGNVGLRTTDPLVGVGIQSGGTTIGTGVTQINFIGTGNTFAVVGDRVDISISGGGGGSSVIRKESYTVTSATQSLFSLVDPYTSGYLDVFVNGVRLSTADFTETSTTSVTLVNPAVTGDVIDFVSVTTVGQNTTISTEVTNLRVTGVATITNSNITNANITNATISSGIITATSLNVLSGNTNIGSAVTIYSSTGIVSATAYYGDGSKLSNISSSGVSTTGILTCRGIANSSVIMESLTLDDYYVQGTNYAMIGPIEVSVGATITVGVGVSYAII